MAINKHNIKNKFRQPQTLPDEFSWDNMKDGINEKMTKAAPIAPKTSFGLYSFYFVVAALFLGGLAYWLTTLDNVKQATVALSAGEKKSEASISSSLSAKPARHVSPMTASSTPSENLSLEKDNPLSENTFTSTKLPHLSGSDQAHTTIIKTKQNKSDNNSNAGHQTSAIATSKSASKEIAQNYIAKESLEIGATSSQDSEVQANTILSGNNAKGNALPISQNQNALDNAIEMKIDATQGMNTNVKTLNDETGENVKSTEGQEKKIMTEQRALLSISSLPSTISHLDYNKVIDPSIQLQATAKPVNIAKTYNKNSIYVYSGVNRGVSTFGNETVEALKLATHSDRYGYAIGLGWLKQLRRHISVDVGFNYSVVNDVFDYKSAPIRYESYKQNAILGIKFDPNTGDTTVIRGEGIERGTKSRVVHWLNVNKRYNLPIVLNYEYQVGKLTIGAGAGPVVSYSSSYSGRSLDSADSIAVLGDDYMAKWSFGAIGQAYVSYEVFSNVSIGFRGNMAMPFNVITSSSYTPLRRYTWGSGLYMAYKF